MSPPGWLKSTWPKRASSGPAKTIDARRVLIMLAGMLEPVMSEVLMVSVCEPRAVLPPRVSKMLHMASTSRIPGTLVSASGVRYSTEAAMALSTAFLAPTTLMVPSSEGVALPVMRKISCMQRQYSAL